MELINNDLDYKILKLLNGKKITIDNFEYKIISDNVLICNEIGDNRFYAITIKNYIVYKECYINDKIVECNKEITEFEKNLIKLIINEESMINNVKYQIFVNFNTKKLVITRFFKTKKVIKKLNIKNGKLISIVTKNSINNIHSFNNNPSVIRFTTEKEIIFLNKYYHNNDKLENFNGCAQESIAFDSNWNEINRSKFNFICGDFLTKEEYEYLQLFCKNGMNIEKFYEIKENEGIDYKLILKGVDKYNRENNVKDEELCKLKILIGLAGGTDNL